MADPVVQLGSGLDTFNTPVVPIVFIPGVMGTRLAMPGGTNWDPDDALAMLSLAGADMAEKQRDLSVFLRADAKPIRPFPSGGGQILDANNQLLTICQKLNPPSVPSVKYAERGWGGAVFGFYKDILTLLETEFNKSFFQIQPHPVFCFGYDWRNSNANNGLLLRARIDDILLKTPTAKEVVIVTHSMGGLVARACVKLTGEKGINAIIHGAQPSNGTPVAYRRFHTGAQPPFEGNTVPDQVLNNVMGTTPIDYTTVQSGLPGPVQLMPNHLYHRTSGSNWLITATGESLDNIYDIYLRTNEPGVFRDPSAFPGLSGVFVQANLATVITHARDFHNMLGNSCHAQTHVIFSDKLNTDVFYDATKNDFATKAVKQLAGDGTVAAVSGSCPDLPADRVKSRRNVPGLEHSKVYTDPTFNGQVVALLNAIFGGTIGKILPLNNK